MSSLALYPYYQVTYFMLRPEPICRAILPDVYSRVRFLVGVLSAVSVFILSFLALVFVLALGRPGCVDFWYVFGYTMCETWVARLAKTVFCTPCSSIFRECESITIIRSRSKLCGNSLWYASVTL